MKLRWTINRLRSMPPAEIPHRVRELARRAEDRRGHSAGRVAALPEELLAGALPAFPLDRALLAEGLAQERPRLRGIVDDLLGGRLTMLGTAWPAGARRAWNLDPVSGQAWPAEGLGHDIPHKGDDGPGDVKLVWELGRLQHLVLLALGAVALDDGAARDAVLADLSSWIAENPPVQGLAWCSGIELSTRVVSLLLLVGLLGADSFPHALARALNRSFYAHGLLLARYPSLHSSANNHRLAEGVGLLLLGLLAPRLPGAHDWESEGRAALEGLVTALILGDGVGSEQAVPYLAYTLEWYAVARQVARAAGRPLSTSVDERLALGLGFLAAIRDRAGNLPHIGDDDGAVVIRTSWRRSEDAGSVAAALAAALGRPELLPPGARQDLRAALLGVRVPQRAWSPPASAMFERGGYTAIRHVAGGHELLAVLDHGPLGFGPIAAHGHADALALCLHVDGVPVLVDPGAFRYNHSQGWRDWLRSTAAHNTVEVEGQSQSEPTGDFNWRARARARWEELALGQERGRVSASHDGYLGRFGVRHRRTIEVLGVDTLHVTDALRGEGTRAVRLSWLFGPAVELRPADEPGCWSLALGERPLGTLRVEGEGLTARLHRQTDMPGPGASSPAYNVLEPAWCLVLEGRLRLPCQIRTRFLLRRDR